MTGTFIFMKQLDYLIIHADTLVKNSGGIFVPAEGVKYARFILSDYFNLAVMLDFNTPTDLTQYLAEFYDFDTFLIGLPAVEALITKNEPIYGIISTSLQHPTIHIEQYNTNWHDVTEKLVAEAREIWH